MAKTSGGASEVEGNRAGLGFGRKAIAGRRKPGIGKWSRVLQLISKDNQKLLSGIVWGDNEDSGNHGEGRFASYDLDFEGLGQPKSRCSTEIAQKVRTGCHQTNLPHDSRYGLRYNSGQVFISTGWLCIGFAFPLIQTLRSASLELTRRMIG